MRYISRVLRAPLITGLLLATIVTGVAIAQDADRGVEIRKGAGGPNLALLDPMKNVLSGRTWLMIEGLDPGLSRRPGWDPLTRMDWLTF